MRMAFRQDFRIVLDGDASHVYRTGECVKGRVILVLPDGNTVKSLSINFIGACTTKTTRPFYVSGNDSDACKSRRDYEERVQYFKLERTLAVDPDHRSEKHSYSFEFKFPELTQGSKSRWMYGSKYPKDPHLLPPSFKMYTNAPNGEARVFYEIQADLCYVSSKTTARRATVSVATVSTSLRYLPTISSTAMESRLRTRVLYHQIWKQPKDSRTAVDKVITKVSRRSSRAEPTSLPRVVPTIHYPERIAPGQHIPILLTLSRDSEGEGMDCLLDSLNVSLSTYTTSMCGQPFTQPEDVLVKHAKCISKANINKELCFSTAINLTNNFRLVDDAECVPSFRTYTVTRYYTMTVIIGLKIQDHVFTIKSTTPLEILPRMPRSEMQREETNIEDEIDPLPLYEPREPSKEFAPDYETLYSLSPASSTAHSLALTDTRGSSFVSGTSTPSTAPTTPELELDQPNFGGSSGNDLADLMRPARLSVVSNS